MHVEEEKERDCNREREGGAKGKNGDTRFPSSLGVNWVYADLRACRDAFYVCENHFALSNFFKPKKVDG